MADIKLAYDQWFKMCRSRKCFMKIGDKWHTGHLPLHTQLIQYRNWKYNLHSHNRPYDYMSLTVKRLLSNVGMINRRGNSRHVAILSWFHGQVSGDFFNNAGDIIAIVENNKWKFHEKPIIIND